MGAKLDQTLAVLNGLVGDYLARTDNGLATEMSCYRNGARIELDAAGIARAYPEPTPRVAVFVHGVMCTESIWRFPDGGDYGERLRAELGITPVYVRYNSGLPLARNGAALSALLQTLVAAYPVPIEELILVGYSMGGLLVRCACHVANELASEQSASWLGLVERALYLGTPHMGAPAERAGRALVGLLHAIPDPYTRLIGDIAALRSHGIRDLGDAKLHPSDPVALLPGIRHAFVAGSLANDPWLAALLGDSLVSIASASGQSLVELRSPDLPAVSVKVIRERSHLDLAHDAETYDFIKQCCEAGP
ncbi:MAG TPA: alpha/beta hydrolase [Polyangiales bacterium]|nr:alpha/beta hydrolase [Polyangiales bacterium]